MRAVQRLSPRRVPRVAAARLPVRAFSPGFVGLLAMVTLVTACAQPSARDAQPSTGSAGGVSGQTSAPKILRMGFQVEPKSFLDPAGRGETQLTNLIHPQNLVEFDGRTYLPHLAAEIPSLENGAWRVFPDGTMTITWRLVPNAKWHDGMPFTSEDLLLGWHYTKSPATLLTAAQWRRFSDRAVAPDPYTFVLHFSQAYARAIEGNVRALPSHILGPVFESGDMERFNNHPYFTIEMLGLGPYRLVSWQQGSAMELARFDEYFRGRPRLDGVLARFYPDVNTLMANIFAGELDLVLPNILQTEQIDPLEQAFRGTDSKIIIHNAGQFQYIQSQFRPEVTRPKALLDRRVRQALYRGLDRQTLTDVMTRGKGPTADSWVPPDDRRRQAVFRDAIPQYPHDPARATRELEEFGFRKGPDGIFATPDGERFQQEVRKTPIPTAEILLGVIRDSWRQMGVETVPLVMTPQLTGDSAYRAGFPGWDISLLTWTNHETNLRSTTPRPGVEWDNGGGRLGYVNPRLDGLIDRLNLTIGPSERDLIHAEILREQMTDLPRLYLWWDVFVVTMSGRVENVKPPFFQPYWGWDAFDWEVR